MLKQSTARNLMVYLVSSTDYVTPVAGASLAVSLSKNGAAFASITPTVTDRGNGWYNLALTSSHTDTLGDFVLRITASGADSIDFREEVFAALPGETVTVAGFSSGAITTASFAAGAINSTVAPNLDAAVSTRLAAASYTAPANADIAAIKAKTDNLAFTVSGLVDVNVYRMNGAVVTGNGTSGNLWRGV